MGIKFENKTQNGWDNTFILLNFISCPKIATIGEEIHVFAGAFCKLLNLFNLMVQAGSTVLSLFFLLCGTEIDEGAFIVSFKALIISGNTTHFQKSRTRKCEI